MCISLQILWHCVRVAYCLGMLGSKLPESSDGLSVCTPTVRTASRMCTQMVCLGHVLEQNSWLFKWVSTLCIGILQTHKHIHRPVYNSGTFGKLKLLFSNCFWIFSVINTIVVTRFIKNVCISDLFPFWSQKSHLLLTVLRRNDYVL